MNKEDFFEVGLSALGIIVLVVIVFLFIRLKQWENRVVSVPKTPSVQQTPIPAYRCSNNKCD